jgi:hypothetical protein
MPAHKAAPVAILCISTGVGVGTGGRTRKKDYLIERMMIVLCVLNTKENYLSCDHCGSREPLTVTTGILNSEGINAHKSLLFPPRVSTRYLLIVF